MPLAAVAGIGAGASLIGGAISSHAAGNAADQQAQAAKYAADQQYKASQNALDFEKDQYNTSQANLAPWLTSGAGALDKLNYLMAIAPQSIPGGATAATGQSTVGTGTTPAVSGMARPTASTPRSAVPSGLTPAPEIGGSTGGYGSLLQPYGETFTAPTGLTEQNDPGYQARLKLGTQAMQQSAAARGNLLTGGTAEALDRLGQDYASNEYNNVYNRAYNTYAANYNAYNQGQANQFNRLAALSDVGQTAANTLGSLGNAASGQVSSNLLNTASAMGNDYQNAAAANASGLVGGANVWNSALDGIGSNLTQLTMLNQLFGGGGKVSAAPQLSSPQDFVSNLYNLGGY